MKFTEEIADRILIALYKAIIFTLLFVFTYTGIGYLYSKDAWFSLPLATTMIIILYTPRDWIQRVATNKK